MCPLNKNGEIYPQKIRRTRVNQRAILPYFCQKLSMLKKLFLLSLPAFLFAACGENFIFEKTLEIPETGWTHSGPLAFDFSVADTAARYDVLLDVRHSLEFGFQNLYVQFHTAFPSGEVKSQVVSLELAGQSGIWNGDCGGTSCKAEIPLQVNALFPEIGEYQIKVEQYMRKDPLPGVEEMTLKVRKKE